MKKAEIRVNGCYMASVSRRVVTVRVLKVREVRGNQHRKGHTAYDVMNLKTGRRITFRSTQRFQESVKGELRPVTEELAEGNAKPMTQLATPNGLAGRVTELKTNQIQHLVVEAFAGTGKTFTQVVGIGWAFGQGIWGDIQNGIADSFGVDREGFEVVPSTEQQAVWDAMAQSRGTVRSVIYCAFNKSIVLEFSEKWGWMSQMLQEQLGVSLRFATINSLGNQAIYRAYGRMDVKGFNVEDMLARHLHLDDARTMKREYPVLSSAVCQLVNLCKLTLAGWNEKAGFSPDQISHQELDELCSFHDVELNGTRERVYTLVKVLLGECMNPKTTIDFNDQNWLPIIHNMPIPKVDLVLIDEGQDLNRVRQEFCRRLGRRILLVGDVNQAIYGFAGADVESIPRMKMLLGVTEPLRLTETRRCAKAIVKEAQRYVPDFKAHADNPEGTVRSQTKDKFSAELEDGDMVLSRVTAPLVSLALRRLRDGKKALIRGREFGQSLVNFVERMGCVDIPELIRKVDDWVESETLKENRKRNPSEARCLAIQDRQACIEAFAQDVTTTLGLTEKMMIVFAGKVCPNCGKHYKEDAYECYNCKTGEWSALSNGKKFPIKVKLVTPKGVLYSTVHKAKGLEAKRVFVLRTKDAPMPHPLAKQAWERQQERSIIYIAITRAQEELVWVVDEKEE